MTAESLVVRRAGEIGLPITPAELAKIVGLKMLLVSTSTIEYHLAAKIQCGLVIDEDSIIAAARYLFAGHFLRSVRDRVQ